MIKENISIKKDDLRLLMIAGFRYALGRRTYIVYTITELIKNYYKIFNNQDWKNFIEDIDFQRKFNDLGDKCDIKTWNKFEEFCKNNIDEGKN